MNNKGYTLIDLIIGLAIMLIAIPIAYNIYLLIHKMDNFSYTQTFNAQDTKLLLNYITEEISDAKAVIVSENQLQYTDKNYNSKLISYNSTAKAVEVYKDETLFLTLGPDNISSISFQDITPEGINKVEVKITIIFVSGDSITTMVMTKNPMS